MQIDHQNEVGTEDDKVELLDLLLFVAENKRRLIALTVAGLVLGLILALCLRPTFSAIAVILPPQQQGSPAALMGQLSSLAELGSAGMNLGIKNPADMYVGLLESRTIADGIINGLGLKSVYHAKTMVASRAELKRHVVIAVGKDGLISITAKDHNPKRASDIANAYVSGLYAMNSHLALTDAAQKRVFLGEQLKKEGDVLNSAEAAFKNVEENTGVIELGGQTESAIRMIANLTAEIASRQVQLNAMRTFATNQNPDFVRTQGEIDELREQLSQLQAAQSKEQATGFQLPAGKIPQASLEYLQRYRNMKFHEALYELLAKQYESARIDEAESAPLIQVVDQAVPPEKKSGPPRLLIILAGAILGFIVGTLWTLFARSLNQARRDSATLAKMTRLRYAIKQ